MDKEINNGKNIFTKKHTQIAKGVAIIFMLFDHLYWMDYGKFISVLPKLPDGHSVEWAIGSIGNICVAMFLTLSGYGMFIVSKNKIQYTLKDSLVRIKNVWLDYAVITVVFIGIDLAVGKITFEPVKIILNILALDYSYNKFAWFMITYIVILLVFPLCNYIFSKNNWWFECLMIVASKVGITVVYALIKHFIVVPDILYKTLIEPFMFLPVFMIGYMCAEYNIFEKVYKCISQGGWVNVKLPILLIMVIVTIYLIPYTVLDNVTAPILCFLVAYLFKDKFLGKALKILGDYSEYIWLIHYSLLVVLLNKWIYSFKYSVILFVILLVISMAIGFLFKRIKTITKRIFEK